MYAALAAAAILLLYWLFQPSFLTAFSVSDFFGNVASSLSAPATNYHKPAPQPINATPAELQAAAVAAYDITSGYALVSEAGDEQRSIASLTKLMTALVFLERNPGWETTYTIERADRREGGIIRLFPGDKLSVRDLFRTALVGSDNVATTALARTTGLSEPAFVVRMNEKAEELRLHSTVFADPTGLNTANRSTARDVARLLEAALKQPSIREALSQDTYSFSTLGGRDVTIAATNKLIGTRLPDNIRLIGGKTGHLDEAGYCFAGWFEQDGHEVITVVLGADSEAARFAETEKLIEWVYNAYIWKQ